MKKIILLTAIVLITGISLIFYFKNSSNSNYALATVERKDLTQEVFANGKIEAPKSIELRFKNNGRLTVLNAKTGKKVFAGQMLAKQETDLLEARLAETQAGVEVQKSRLNQMQLGASTEEITLAETTVTGAKKAVDDAKQNFIDILRDNYTKADDAIRGKADQLFNNPRSGSPSLILFTSDSSLKSETEWRRLFIEGSVFRVWEPAVNQLTASDDLILSANDSRKYLNEIKTFLDKLSLILNNPNTNYVVNGVSQAIPQILKTDVSTARTNINISLSNLSAAEEKLKTANSNLKVAEDQLSLKKAPLRPSDAALYEAQIRQAEAQMQQIRAQIKEMEIVAPVSGMVTATNGEVGEIIDPGTVVVSLISSDALQVKINLSEDNVADVKVGQPVRIIADALPNEWQGTVIEIDPAATIIGGSVYYKTAVTFNQPNAQVKTGMTVDAWIQTGSAENALTIPVSAVKKNNQQTFVQIFKNNKIIKQNVVTGLKGKDGMVEIVSGLSEGEKVILGDR